MRRDIRRLRQFTQTITYNQEMAQSQTTNKPNEP